MRETQPLVACSWIFFDFNMLVFQDLYVAWSNETVDHEIYEALDLGCDVLCSMSFDALLSKIDDRLHQYAIVVPG